MSIVLCGYHNMGCIALEVFERLGLEVSALFTHRDNSSENRWFSVPAPLARSMGIPVYYPDDINAPEWVSVLKELKPSLLVSCYYRDMISEEVLSIPSVAAVNLHGSLLPKYRGRCPVNWQLIHGEKRSGVTLHHMVRQADAGDIVAQKSVEISRSDDAVALFAKLEEAARDILTEYIPKLLDGTAPRIPQDHERATYFGGRRPEDGRIDWNWEAERIYNLVRAVTWPYPGAFSMLDGCKMMFWKTEVVKMDSGLEPGTVSIYDNEPIVQAGRDGIRILCMTQEGMTPESGDISREILFSGMRFV